MLLSYIWSYMKINNVKIRKTQKIVSLYYSMQMAEILNSISMVVRIKLCALILKLENTYKRYLTILKDSQIRSKSFATNLS